MAGLSRRDFLGSGAAAGATALVPRTDAQAQQRPAAAASAPTGHPRYRFLMPHEAVFIEAAVERLIPPDALGPSALEAGVPTYIDLQLAGPWGSGERLYRSGPWQPGLPSQGYQLPLTPAEMFRTALRGIAADLQRDARAFEHLPGATQDAYLSRLQTGGMDLGGVPSDVFFETLLALTIEGYFCDPVHGGNRDMASWRMIGFPGAHANYYTLVDRHGVAFDAAPRSLAQDAAGRVHVIAPAGHAGGHGAKRR